jgi:DNA-binding NtrC family response regulator
VSDSVLIIDDDRFVDEVVASALSGAGLLVETVTDGFSAIEKLRQHRYGAVILDPAIRHRLNGFAVLSFIEMEQPEMLERLFFLTGMSAQTIARTAPKMLHNLFRKPLDVSKVANAVLALALSDRLQHEQRTPARSVLIVEDDRTTAAALASMVAQLGYEVTMACNGREALERLSSEDYAAILLDLVLPDVDGFAVLHQLEASRPSLLQRMIITTGMPERYTEEIDRRNLCGIMHKPVQSSELTALLQRCVGRETQ